ncbi:MAG TPA: hypothetical protein VHC22_26685 [Pirellulales bacterium]|nr:hypothetical protein [Pirellulales bacterium]
MGIDWSRMRPKHDADPAEVERLIRRQAEAFQATPYHWATDTLTPDSYLERTREQSERAYLEAFRALKELLDFPEYDDETDQCRDRADLAPCWRVYAITWTTVFPPQWRLRAHRTILPHELASQIEEWQSWLSAVEAGRFRRYLLDLYIYEATMVLRVHDELLKDLAAASLSKQTAWARRPELAVVREQILGLTAPDLASAPLRPATDDESFFDPGDDARYRDLQQRIAEVCTLTQDWNRAVRKPRWRLDTWHRGNHPDFDGFLAQARDPWLRDFLNWAETCNALGMGLFFDY